MNDPLIRISEQDNSRKWMQTFKFLSSPILSCERPSWSIAKVCMTIIAVCVHTWAWKISWVRQFRRFWRFRNHKKCRLDQFNKFDEMFIYKNIESFWKYLRFFDLVFMWNHRTFYLHIKFLWFFIIFCKSKLR